MALAARVVHASPEGFTVAVHLKSPHSGVAQDWLLEDVPMERFVALARATRRGLPGSASASSLLSAAAAIAAEKGTASVAEPATTTVPTMREGGAAATAGSAQRATGPGRSAADADVLELQRGEVDALMCDLSRAVADGALLGVPPRARGAPRGAATSDATAANRHALRVRNELCRFCGVDATTCSRTMQLDQFLAGHQQPPESTLAELAARGEFSDEESDGDGDDLLGGSASSYIDSDAELDESGAVMLDGEGDGMMAMGLIAEEDVLDDDASGGEGEGEGRGEGRGSRLSLRAPAGDDGSHDDAGAGAGDSPVIVRHADAMEAGFAVTGSGVEREGEVAGAAEVEADGDEAHNPFGASAVCGGAGASPKVKAEPSLTVAPGLSAGMRAPPSVSPARSKHARSRSGGSARSNASNDSWVVLDEDFADMAGEGTNGNDVAVDSDGEVAGEVSPAGDCESKTASVADANDRA
mmetsp:Transcript_28259/g.79059  ORF Transcript_28259/g.79059 Transcript_28259/m.79059 type:complete len:471 (-) Transcript_28259:225-1637(-)